MEHNGSASNADKIHQNRLSSVTEDEDQDAALTIVTVLDKVAAIVDSVQASQKRIEERHRAMENAMKTVQIDLLKFSQSHSNTGYVINKLMEKTRKISAHIKEVRARVEKQQTHVKKVESKQEEIMKKNKFRVVIFQVSWHLCLARLLLSVASFNGQQVLSDLSHGNYCVYACGGVLYHQRSQDKTISMLTGILSCQCFELLSRFM